MLHISTVFVSKPEHISYVEAMSRMRMSMLSAPMVKVVLSQRWLDAAPILEWLSVAMVPSLFVGPLPALVISLRKIKPFARLALIEVCFKLTLMVLGATHRRSHIGAIGDRPVYVVLLHDGSARTDRDACIETTAGAPGRPVACASIMALVIRSSDKWLMNLSIEGWAIDEAAEVVAVGQDGFGRIATALKIIAMDPALEFRDGR
jgi:hypothetical protein